MTTTSKTLVPVGDPARVIGLFADHIRDDHDMVFDTAEDGSRYIDQDGFRLEMRAEPNGLRVTIKAPHESALVFFKEEFVKHVAELDPVAAGQIRWSGETATVGSLPPNFRVLEVVGGRAVFPGLLRVTLRHEEASGLGIGGIHLRLMLPLRRDRRPVWPRMAENGTPVWPTGDDTLHARFITLRHVRPNEVDIDIVDHDGGLIAEWARKAQPGGRVGVMGPAGETSLPVKTGLFLAADATGIAAVARMMEAAGPDVEGHAAIAATSLAVARDYLRKSRLSIEALPQVRFEDEIVGRAKALTKFGVTQYAFFAGEFQNAQDLRAQFKRELGLGKNAQLSTAYWRRGVPGFGG
ncbi:MAG: siderophore-interacting protein [Pseudomonadota bacterium]